MHYRQAGFTYLLALFALGIASLVAVQAIPVVETFERREKEAELLFVGHQFRRAIASYYQSTPGTVKRYPLTLDDLLLDKRFLGVKRHLRRIYVDPITMGKEWGLLRGPDGGINGIHSTSESVPIKQQHFRGADVTMNNAQSYRQWHFVYVPPKDFRAPQAVPEMAK